MKKEKSAEFPCPLCERKLEIRKTVKKNPKPYMICEDCGVQLFVRGKTGIDRLKKKVSVTTEDADWDLF